MVAWDGVNLSWGGIKSEDLVASSTAFKVEDAPVS